MSEQTIKCPICGNPYVVYMHYAGDQSACESCRNKARGRGEKVTDLISNPLFGYGINTPKN